jgi:polyhydroxybutyrate depolymerase
MGKLKRGVLALCGVLIFSSCGIPAVRLTERDLFLNLEHDGYRREYILHLPLNHEKLARPPLVLALHGGGGTAKGMIRLTKGRFNELADEYGFLVVYPQGLEKSWNDDRDDPISFAHKNDIDDVGFLSTLIRLMAQKYKADPQRVFATGISNGGFMSFRVSRELASEVKAVAPACAQIPQSSRQKYLDAAAISIMLMNGTADPLVPYEGGYVEVLGQKRGRVISTDETIEIFKKRNACSGSPSVQELPDLDPGDGTRVIRYEYKNDAGSRVILMKVMNGGHAWPGGWPYLGERIIGRTSRDINACDAIWEFFRSF